MTFPRKFPNISADAKLTKWRTVELMMISELSKIKSYLKYHITLLFGQLLNRNFVIACFNTQGSHQKIHWHCADKLTKNKAI